MTRKLAAAMKRKPDAQSAAQHASAKRKSAELRMTARLSELSDDVERDAAAIDEDEARRIRREERRAARAAAETGEEVRHRGSRRRSTRESGDEGLASSRHRYRRDEEMKPAWPHSGTSSWVKEHTDAGPPPEDGGQAEAIPMTEDEMRRERRERRRRARYEEGTADEADDRRRKARREERERRYAGGGSEGSDERRRQAMFSDATPRSSWWRKWTG
uniref:Uncharacterized protein n=1 Tax=Colletotrichum fructicola (strain Nara gc5) TaxID=1213859 RepID=L2G4I0_COLFN